MAGQPKAPFYIAVLFVVGGLVALAAYQATKHRGPKQDDKGNAPGLDITMPKAGSEAGGSGSGAEAPDTHSITTVKEYKFKPSERLPAVKGTAAYKPLQNNTVRFALNV